MGANYPTQQAYSSSSGTNPNYVTGNAGIPPALCNIPFNPFTMVIDLKTAKVLAKDKMGDYVETNEIVSLVQQANQ